MSVRNFSTVRIKASEVSPELRKRYGLFDEDELTAELDKLQRAGAWKQDQRLKNDITSVLHRLELDNVKPDFDVLAHTGFRRGYQVRNRSPGEVLIASPQPPATDRGRTPSRRYSYIEPRLVRQHLEEHVPIHAERSVRFIEPEPVRRRTEPASSPAWNYTEPRSLSFLQSTVPSFRRAVEQTAENRALTEYTDSLAAAPRRQQQLQRWSVYGLAPVADWRRSQSTPPEFYRMSTVRPVGDRLTRRRNHEFAIGVKLAESQTELDTFNRMLDKRFGGNSGAGSDRSNLWRSRSLYPSYWPTTYYPTPPYYDYKTPRITTYYSNDLYGNPTRVTKPSEILVHSNPRGYRDYVPYTTSYSNYVPLSYVDYGRSSYRGYEPWYSSYPRSSYYVDRSRHLF